jgi:hypothetical protein
MQGNLVNKYGFKTCRLSESLYCDVCRDRERTGIPDNELQFALHFLSPLFERVFFYIT